MLLCISENPNQQKNNIEISVFFFWQAKLLAQWLEARTLTICIKGWRGTGALPKNLKNVLTHKMSIFKWIHRRVNKLQQRLSVNQVYLRKTQHFFNYSKSSRARKLKFCTVLTLVLETTWLKFQSCISVKFQDII